MLVLKYSHRWRKCHEVIDEGNNVKLTEKYPSSVTAYAVPPSPPGRRL